MKSNRHARVRSRRCAVQALYQWQMSDTPMQEIIFEFIRERSELRKADKDYFVELLIGIANETKELDLKMEPLLDRSLEELDPVEKAILRLGLYELERHPELPWKVVLDEAVELAKLFGAEQSYKFVNGVLDKAVHKESEVPPVKT